MRPHPGHRARFMVKVNDVVGRKQAGRQALAAQRQTDPTAALQLIAAYDNALENRNQARQNLGLTKKALCRAGGRGDVQTKVNAENTVAWHDTRCQSLQEQLIEARLWPITSELRRQLRARRRGQLTLPL